MASLPIKDTLKVIRGNSLTVQIPLWADDACTIPFAANSITSASFVIRYQKGGDEVLSLDLTNGVTVSDVANTTSLFVAVTPSASAELPLFTSLTHATQIAGETFRQDIVVGPFVVGSDQ
jgi:hypothetical protein